MYYGPVIAFALLAVVVFLTIVLKKKSSRIVYDERQTNVRGAAYKYATFTGVLAGLIAAFLLELGILPMDGSFVILTVSLLTITVYIEYMVLKGVFFGVAGNWKNWTALVFVVGLCNFITGALRIFEDGLPDGKMNAENINLTVGIMFLIIAATVMIRKARETKDEEV